MGEVTGGLAIFGLAATALTVWIPGLGIPISAGLAGKCLTEMGKAYANLPTDQRRIIAKCAKWLHALQITIKTFFQILIHLMIEKEVNSTLCIYKK